MTGGRGAWNVWAVIDLKRIIILISILIVIVLAGCTQQEPVEVPVEKVDLCNEVGNPAASVNCDSNGCHVTISGDSRVTYRFREYGARGVLAGQTQAGERTKLNSNTQDRIEITAYDNTQQKECENRKTIVYRDQFTGDVVDNSHLQELYGK